MSDSSVRAATAIEYLTAFADVGLITCRGYRPGLITTSQCRVNSLTAIKIYALGSYVTAPILLLPSRSHIHYSPWARQSVFFR